MTKIESSPVRLRKRILTGLLILLGIDAPVFCGSWIPSELGYVGSESHEWTMLALYTTTAVIGLCLVCALVIVYCIRPRKEPPVDS